MLSQFQNLIIAVLILLLPANATPIADKTTSSPSPTETSPPPPGKTYETRYPICGLPGFLEVPGPFVQTTYASGLPNDTITLQGIYIPNTMRKHHSHSLPSPQAHIHLSLIYKEKQHLQCQIKS